MTMGQRSFQATFFLFALVCLVSRSCAAAFPGGIEDDQSSLSEWDEDVFYEEEPAWYHDSRSSDDSLLDDISLRLGRRNEFSKRQTNTPGVSQVPGTSTQNPGDAAGVNANNPMQTTNLTGVQNQTNVTLTTNGTIPSYVGNPENPNADQVNCSDLVTGRANDCWVKLNLTQYVKDWIKTHQCYSGEGFSTCYLRQSGFPGLDCSRISVSSCVAPQSDSIVLDPPKFYIAYNIYAINAFFYSWWQAVGNSGGIAVNNVGKIVQILNPPDTMSVAIQNILVAFQSVFALAPGLAGVWAARNAYSYGFQVAAQSISNALATAPNIGRYLFPTDSAQSQIIQLAELTSNFATILQQVQSNLNQTLVSVMSNYTEFLAFAEQGNFTSRPQSLPDQANYLYYAFNTYLISQAMNGNNIYAVVGKGTNPYQLANNGTNLAYPIDDCKDGYNEQGVCDAWWWSEGYNSSFTLDNFNHMNKNYGKEMTELFTNLTSGELLFDGAYRCNSQGQFGGPVNVTVDAGGVSTACISQLKVLTWDMGCHKGDDEGDGDGPAPDCEFLEMSRQKTFWFNNKHLYYTPIQRSVPAGYLGPAINKGGKPPLKRD